jgi:DinB superfamily
MERHDLIARYRGGTDAVCEALAGITPDELDRRPAATSWTAREIVHHVADSETNSYIRLRKLVAEDETWIQGYDEAHWARVLHYDRPIEVSLAVLRAVRDGSAELMERLADADWARSGTHRDSGAYSMSTWLEIYADHPYIHADQIRRARRGEV